MIRQRPEVQRQRAALPLEEAAEVRVVPGVDLDVVVVDRLGDEPFPGRGPVGMVHDRAEPAVRGILHRVGDRDRDPLAVRLVAAVVLVRPPHRGAQPFVGRRHPRMPHRVDPPDQSPVPRRPARRPRLAVVVDGDRVHRPCPLRRHERHEERVTVAPEAETATGLYHAVGHQRLLQIDLHRPARLQHPVADAVPAADGAVSQ